MQNQPSNETPSFSLVCDVCKRQDESLRAVTYPFVISVVFMTFQRTFSGIYCAKHQRRYHILASWITSLLGWLGIPFGFILTPLTLLKLAGGGVIHVQESVYILNQVADTKLRSGDTTGAIRCLEQALRLQDHPAIREKLSRLYQQYLQTGDRNVTHPIWQFIAIPILFGVVMIPGMIFGLADTIVTWLLSPYTSGEISIFVAIAGWLPTVLFLFSGILIVRAMLQWSLQKMFTTSVLLASLISITATGLFFYSMLLGEAALRTLRGLFTFFSISVSDGIFALRSVLTHGGIDVLINDLEQGPLAGTIYIVLLAAGIGLSLYVGIEMVRQTTQWHARILQLRPAHSPEFGGSSTLSGSVLGALLVATGIAMLLLYPGRYVNMERVAYQIDLGTDAIDQNRVEEGIDYFRQISRAWPDSVTTHAYLGLGYLSLHKLDDALHELDLSTQLDPNSNLARFFRVNVLISQGKFKEAVSELDKISMAQPEWGMPYAFRAILHYNLDENELAQNDIEKAIAYQNNDGQTISLIGSYYISRLDFDKAEEYFLKALELNHDSQDYLYLARIYTHHGQFEQARKTIEDASTAGASASEIYLAKSNLAVTQKDLDGAETLLLEAVDKFPLDSDLWSELSFVHLEQGDVNAALREATKAVELNPYDSNAYVDLAFAYEAQGNITDALAAAQKSISLYPKYDRAHYILGLCYMRKNMNQEAIAEFETFLELYWDRPHAQKYKVNAEKFLTQLK